MRAIYINLIDVYSTIAISIWNDYLSTSQNIVPLMQKYFAQILESKLYNVTMYTIIWRFKTGTAIIIMAWGIEVFLKFGEEKN